MNEAIKRDEMLKEVEDNLRSLGLSDIEVRTYTFILNNSGSTISDVANALGITRQWAHKVLKKLYRKGVVYSSNQKPIHFYASPPEVAGLILAREKEREFYKALKIQESLIELSNKLYRSEFENLTPKSFGEISVEINGRDAVISTLKKTIVDAENFVTILATKNEILRIIYELKSELYFAKSKGTRVQIISNFTEIPNNIIKVLTELVECYHIKDTPTCRLYIKDEKEVLLLPAEEGAKSRKSYDLAVFIRSSEIAKMMNKLISQLHKKIIKA